jgi:hypothetical protein
MFIWRWLPGLTFWQLTFLAVVVGSLLSFNGILLSEYGHKRLQSLGNWMSVAGLLVGLGWSIAATVRLMRATPDFISALVSALHKYKAAVFVAPALAIGIAVVGTGLFLFRTYARRRYGAAETMFAVASIIVASSNAVAHPAIPSNWTTVIGGAYLLVRGLDNATYDMDVPAVVTSFRLRLRKMLKSDFGQVAGA